MVLENTYEFLNEMEYGNVPKKEVLCKGERDGYEYFIVSYGTHPCAYVVLPLKHTLNSVEVDSEMDNYVNVHGGVTFLKNHLLNHRYGDRKVIGWDYNHYNDQYGNVILTGVKYRTVNLLWDVMECIDDLENYS